MSPAPPHPRIRFLTPWLPPVSEIEPYYSASEQLRWYSNGGPCQRLLTQRLEQRLARGLHCLPVASGTLALMLAIRSVRPPEGAREVLLPSFTFAAVAGAVQWAGFEPVFVDVDERTWQMSPDALADALASRGDRVAMILAASTMGLPPSGRVRGRWEVLARDAHLPLVVDSAAGFGAVADDGTQLGGQGDVEIFSFHATKPFAIGEGGLLVTADPGLAERAARLANFGLRDGVVEGQPGLNAKLAEWPAATALAVLDRFDHVLSARREIAAELLARLEPAGFAGPGERGDPAWQFVPVRAPSRAVHDAVLARGAGAGVELRSLQNQALHRMPAFSSAVRAGPLPATELLAERGLALPMANDLSTEAIRAIVSCCLP